MEERGGKVGRGGRGRGRGRGEEGTGREGILPTNPCLFSTGIPLIVNFFQVSSSGDEQSSQLIMPATCSQSQGGLETVHGHVDLHVHVTNDKLNCKDG